MLNDVFSLSLLLLSTFVPLYLVLFLFLFGCCCCCSITFKEERKKKKVQKQLIMALSTLLVFNISYFCTINIDNFLKTSFLHISLTHTLSLSQFIYLQRNITLISFYTFSMLFAPLGACQRGMNNDTSIYQARDSQVPFFIFLVSVGHINGFEVNPNGSPMCFPKAYIQMQSSFHINIIS